MIATICMNPSFDRTVTVDSLTIGGTNRVRSARTDVGGKGVNVARVLTRLGLDALCLGLVGRENGDAFLKLLEEERIRSRFLRMPGSVRTNTKVVSLSGLPVTELNEPGPAAPQEDVAAFMALAARETAGAAWCVLTGSLPGGCGAACYRDLMRCMPRVRCMLDVSGEALLMGLEAHPFLVKPNQDELRQTLGRPMESHQAITEGARELIRRGAGNVLVSMGGEGAMLVTPERVLYAPSVPVEVHSTVGAGDAMVGGLLYGLQKTGSLEEALRYGVAAGTASVMTEGTQLIRPGDFEALLPRVQIQEE